MGEEKKKLVLIDGNAIMHRAYHALPPLSTKKGELVNAVYGFASTLFSVIENFKPDYIAASFDLAGPTFRHEEYKEYKATRTKAPDEFYNQIPRVKEFVQAFNIPIYEKEGYEADDVIGTLAKQAQQNEELEVIIVTGDLDTLQLVTDKTKVYTMRRGLSDSVIYDAEKIKERYNLTPIQIIDYKGLRGDPSDNIPGVKGIGEKTAVELLTKYESVEKIYQNLNEIKGSVKEKLERDRLKAFMSKKLATIKLDVPVNLDLEKTRVHDFDREKLVALFGELNFYSLIKRIPKNTNSTESKPIVVNDLENNGVKDFKYEEVDGKNADEFWKEIGEQKEISLAIDALGENNRPEIRGLAFSWKPGRSFYLKYSSGVFEKVKKILEDENIKKIGYDFKNILKVLNFYNIELKGIYFDEMIAAYILDPGVKIEFNKLVMIELGEEIVEEENKSGQLSMMIDEDMEQKKAQSISRRSDYIFKLKSVLLKKIQSICEEQKKDRYVLKDIEKLFFDIEMPLVEILSKMEFSGMKLNTIVLKGILEKIEERIKNLEESIYKLSGEKFNINSPSQLSEVLFEKMKLSTADIKKTKTKFSTASSELEKLRSKHKIIEKIEEYREIFKLKTTYLDTLPALVDKNSRLHTTFNQTVTATGRLSSSDPNLQNIPIKTDLGQLMRTAFVAEDGYKLVSGDYSQIDLRIVAHMSDDKKLIEAFVRGDDIHKITAAEINKVTLSQVTDKMRRGAKALNFGVIYGMSVFGFSKASGIEREDAKKFIDEYMRKFSGVANYIIRTKEIAKRNGYVETLLGRRRNISEINSPNFQVAQGAERMAINMPIQGLAADIVKLAMIKIYDEYKNNSDVRMILQIHDEIILEANENIASEVSLRVKALMESVFKLKVPLIADVSVGDNWGEI
ncbi:MAG: DNA polymerase I [Parcubacteria group bacterium]|jgi:DNA polymerase-1